MTISVTSPFVSDYLRSKNNEPLVFNTIEEMLRYMADRNCTIQNLLEFEYEIRC